MYSAVLFPVIDLVYSFKFHNGFSKSLCPKLTNCCAWSIKYRYCSDCCLLWYNSDFICVPHRFQVWANLVTYKLLSFELLLGFIISPSLIVPFLSTIQRRLLCRLLAVPLCVYFILSCLRNTSSLFTEKFPFFSDSKY